MSKDTRNIERWAAELESLMDSARVSCSGFVTHLLMQNTAQSSAARIQSHIQMLDMFDDLLLHLGGVGKLLSPAKDAFCDYKLADHFPLKGGSDEKSRGRGKGR